MDKNDVKACLRALLSSTTISYSVSSLLYEFKNTEGCDMPTFEFDNPISFLESLHDTVKLFGNPYNPEICLVESKKSSHITSLVERQRSNIRLKIPQLAHRNKRIIIPCETDCQTPVSTQNPHWSNKSEKQGSRFNKEKMSNREENTQRNFNCQESVQIKNSDQFEDLALRSRRNSKISFENHSRLDKSSVGSDKQADEEDSCFFKDIPDDEGSHSSSDISSGRSSFHVTSSSTAYVNDGMKNKLKNLIKQYPNGLWCSDLPKSFYNKYNFELDFREFGYTSLIRMVSESPDIFRCVRPGSEDWILFDASVEPSSKELMMINAQKSQIPCEVKNNLIKLLSLCDETSPDIQLTANEVFLMYKELFGHPINFQSYGFHNFKLFLESLNQSVLNIVEKDNICFVEPISKTSRDSSAVNWKALPPITADNDIFYELFPSDVVGPNYHLKELDLTNHLALGQLVEVCVAEVWSPSKFFLQLYEFRDEINQFMDDLQNFYNIHFKKYKMPEATIRSEQLCVALYNPDQESLEEWHRAKILKVVNDKNVSIYLVDYGTVTRVKKSQLRFLHKNFQTFPPQAFQAKLAGIKPVGEENKWTESVSKKFLEFVRVPFLEAEIVEADFKKPLFSVILYNRVQKPAININRKLVLEKLAIDAIEKPNSLPSTDFSKETRPQTKCSEKNYENTLRDVFENVIDLNVCESTEENKNFKEESETISNFTPQPEPGLLNNTSDCYSEKVIAENTTKPIKVPPGLQKVNHFEDLNQLQCCLFDHYEVRKKINLLAINLLATNLNIKEIAVINPELALKMATNLAENYMNNLNAYYFGLMNTCNPFATDISSSMFVNSVMQGQNPMFVESSYPFSSQSNPYDWNFGNFLKVCNGSLDECVGGVGIKIENQNKNLPESCAEALSISEKSKKTKEEIENGHISNNSKTEVLQQQVPCDMQSRDSEYCTDLNGEIVKKEEDTNGDNNVDLENSNTKDEKQTKSPDECCPVEENENVECLKIASKVLHVVTIEGEKYYLADELIHLFTTISCRSIADKILQVKKYTPQYKAINKNDKRIYCALNKNLLASSSKKKKKNVLCLLPVGHALKYLQALDCQTNLYAKEFEDFLKNVEEAKNC